MPGGGFGSAGGIGLGADDLLPLLPRDGTRPMEADLDLFRDPSQAQHSATKRYVDALVHSAPLMVGVFSAPAAIAQFFPGSGYPSGPIPPATALQIGEYLVCIVGGTAPPGSELPVGSIWAVGDWLICAGATWAVIPAGAHIIARQVQVEPPVHDQTNVQAALERTIDRTGDTMTGPLIATLFRVDNDGSGLVVATGAAFYRPVNGPLIIRLDSTNAQPLLENNNGTNRRAILDALNGVLKIGDTMAGFLTLFDDPTQPLHAATRRYVDAVEASANLRVLRAGDTMTGALIIQGNNLISKINSAIDGARATLSFGTGAVDHFHIFRNNGATLLELDAIDTGGTVRAVFNVTRATGVLNFLINPTFNPPTQDNHAATRAYAVAKAGDTMTGGLGFGSVAQADARDVSRHLALWGGGTTGFGINITGGHINIIAAANASNLIGFMAGTKTTPTAEVSNTGIHLLVTPTANNHATTKLYVDTVANRVLMPWTAGANYAVDQGVVWDGIPFRVVTAITNAPAVPDFNTLRLYGSSQGDYWRGVPAGWVTGNWMHLLTMAPYGSYRVQIDGYGVGVDESLILEVACTFNAAHMAIVLAHNPSNFMFDQFRLSATGGSNAVRLEAHIRNAGGSPDFKIFVTGFARQNNNNTTTIQKPPTGQAANLGGTQYELIDIESGSSGNAVAPSFVTAAIQTNTGGWIRFPHANATNRDDGRISARLHARGLNIVGIGSEAAEPTVRYISLYGEVEVTGSNNFRTLGDGAGLHLFGGSRIYKASGSGLVMRKSSGNQQVQVENNDGTGRTPILVQAEADLRYATAERAGRIAAGVLLSRVERLRSEGADAGIGNNPPTLRANSNSIHVSNANFPNNGIVYLPAIAYLPNGEPFFYESEATFPLNIQIERTSMTAPLALSANNKAVFVRHGNVWDYVGTVPNDHIPESLKFNALANSYRLPANRGTSGQWLRSNGDGTTSWTSSGAFSPWEDHIASTSFTATSRLRTRFVQEGERIEIQCRQSYIALTGAEVSRPILLNPLPANKRPPYEVHGFGATGTTLSCVVITIDNISGAVSARSLPGSPNIPAGNFLDFNFTYPAAGFAEREIKTETSGNGKGNGKIHRIMDAIRAVLAEG